MPVPQTMRVSYQFSEKFMLKRQSERVAQAVEHVTFNHGVVGSSPTALTKQVQYHVRVGVVRARGCDLRSLYRGRSSRTAARNDQTVAR